jgi:GNAT superfamily N-acetyltransferase
MESHPLRIQKLTPASLPQFLQFFDGDAFSDNPKWSSCYCQCFYEDHNVVKWSERTSEQNRALACRRTATGQMQGYIATDGDNPVGWCGAAPRHLVHALDAEPTPDSEKVGAIICFLVSPNHRGQGIAKALLEAACTGLREQGLTIVEANPRPHAQTPAENHFGPLSLYLSAGFSVHRQDADGSVHVRRAL